MRENAKQAGSVVRWENNLERKEPWCADWLMRKEGILL